MIDDALDHTRDVRDRPLWQEMPDDVRACFDTKLPQEPTPLEDVYRMLTDKVMPYPMGNIHPRFWM